MTVVITRKEWKKQQLLFSRDHTNSNKSCKSNTKLSVIVQFSLRYLPIITLNLISLSLLLMELGQWSYICLISNPLEICIKAISWICIGYFQLSRLYYIFGDSHLQNNDIKSYPNWLFIFIFMCGAIIIVYFLIIPWVGFSVHDLNHSDLSVHDLLQNGCISSNKMDSIFIFYTAWSILFIVALDWLILSLYFMKLCQFYKISDQSTHSEKTRVIYDRIGYILKKIVFLTILYQFAAVSMGIIRAYTKYNAHEYGLIIVHSSIALERIILSIVTVLMIEHNDSLYQALINKVCCCFNGCKGNESNNNNNVATMSPIANNSPTTEFYDEDNEDRTISSSVPVLSIGSAPKQLNVKNITLGI